MTGRGRRSRTQPWYLQFRPPGALKTVTVTAAPSGHHPLASIACTDSRTAGISATHDTTQALSQHRRICQKNATGRVRGGDGDVQRRHVEEQLIAMTRLYQTNCRRRGRMSDHVGTKSPCFRGGSTACRGPRDITMRRGNLVREELRKVACERRGPTPSQGRAGRVDSSAVLVPRDSMVTRIAWSCLINSSVKSHDQDVSVMISCAPRGVSESAGFLLDPLVD